MIIGVDIKDLAKVKAGKEWYVYRILEQWAKNDRKNHYILYGKEKCDVPLPYLAKTVWLKKKGFAWHREVVKRLKEDKVDVYFAPTSPIVPALSPTPTVFTLHDLTVLLFPGKHTLSVRLIERVFMKRAIRRSKAVITISEASKRDIIKLAPESKDKIVVTKLGIDSSFRPLDGKVTREVLVNYGLKEGYILFVGTLEPRKNINTIIEAYSMMDREKRKNYPLVIVGKKGWYYEGIFKLVKDLNLEKEIIFLGYVPEEDLPGLYNGAKVFVYPSYYEGFGLPVVEAMACGTAAITSNVSSLPEVAGGAAIMVSPEDEVGLKDKIELLLDNDEERKRRVGLGLAQAEKFKWEETAKETLEVIEKSV